MISELMGGDHSTTHARKLKLDSCGKGSIRTELQLKHIRQWQTTS